MNQALKDKYKGRPVNTVLAECDSRLRTAGAELTELQALLQICQQATKDPYRRGQIAQRVWLTERRLGLNKLFFSQAGQDRYVHSRFFASTRNGVFVEIGGYNGFEGSNCLFFEKFMGWTGIIVEAARGLADMIPTTRSQPVVHAAIMDRDGTAEFIEVTRGYTQMGGLAESYDPGMIDTVRRSPQHEERTVQVPAMRLDTLLRAHRPGKIDYMSIDAEGAERLILEPFDFSEFDISVITTENNTGTEAGSVGDILRPAGYRLDAIVGVDEVWTKLPG